MYDITEITFGVLCTYFSVNFVYNKGEMSDLEFVFALLLFIIVFIFTLDKKIFSYVKDGHKVKDCIGYVRGCVTRIRNLLGVI